MQDRVAEVLAQRAALDRGPAAAVVLAILLHAIIFGGAIYAALHAPPPESVRMVSIQFAKMPAMSSPSTTKAAPKKAAAPALEEPKPIIQEPKPAPETPAPEPVKNTVPLSPFGRSTKKGSEAPATPVTSAPSMAGEPGMTSPATSTAPEVAIGGSGVTGLEGGDFPYTLYIQGMHRKIGAGWLRPQAAAGATTVVYFRIARDGKITDAKVETSSGNGTFDRAALSAVRSASPLNPLPFAYSGTYLGVHLTFR
jgi:periplasmic protein TonB